MKTGKLLKTAHTMFCMKNLLFFKKIDCQFKNLQDLNFKFNKKKKTEISIMISKNIKNLR